MNLTPYEIARRGVEPLLPPLYGKVRKQLIRELGPERTSKKLLDVGGRKSPYTIGLPARVTIIDLPRESEVQKELNLGVNDQIVAKIKSRRSNVENVIFGDMTRSDIASEAFDMVVSVEVIEHVDDDERFVSEVSRVLVPGGKFIMTTPNGDFVKNTNPDHKRHYRREQLTELLARHFADVNVEYAIAGGPHRARGLRSWEVRRPLQTLSSVLGNVVNSVQSTANEIGERPFNTHHLFAVAQKEK